MAAVEAPCVWRANHNVHVVVVEWLCDSLLRFRATDCVTVVVLLFADGVVPMHV